MSYNLVVMAETFGQWLKRHRKLKGWTQDDLFKKSGVSVSYISTLEREQPHSITGAKLRPEPDKVEKLAKALDQAVNEALQLAGYAPNATADSYEILDGATVSFDEKKFTKAEQKRLLDIMRTLAAGVKAEKEKEEK